jgi:hypothetical protein
MAKQIQAIECGQIEPRPSTTPLAPLLLTTTISIVLVVIVVA